MINRASTLTALAGLAMLSTTASAQFWALGTGIGLSSDISNTGIATGSGASGGSYYAWTPTGGAANIGGVSAGSGVGGQAMISNDGRYVGGTTFNADQGYHEMGRYDMMTGMWTGFGAIPVIGQQIDAEVSSGWNISGDGRHVVGLGWTTEGTADTHAMQWTEGAGITDLGSATVGNSARANAVNFDGTVVAGWQDGAGRQGSVWVNGVQELITTDTAQPAQEAFAVSDDGRYASGMGIGSRFGTPPGFAYRYNIDTDTYESLPNLDSGAARFMAGAAMNGDGSLVGGGTWGAGPATFGTAFIWQEGVGTMTVGEYLTSVGASFDESFHFAFVSSISADGQWLTGWGNFGSPATTQTWVVHIPAPSGFAALGLAGLATTRRRR